MILALAASLLGARARGEDLKVEPGVSLTPLGGWTSFDPGLRFSTGQQFTDAPYFGGRASFRLHSPLWFEGAGGYSRTTPDVGGDDVVWTHASGNLLLTPPLRRRLVPFVSVGAGWGMHNHRVGVDEDAATLEAALGIRARLTKVLGLRLEARDLYSSPRRNVPSNEVNNLVYGIGITVGFGPRDEDTDRDGVPDKLDRCPDTPRGVRVDGQGCPIEVVEKETEMLDTGMIRISNVNFETARAELANEAQPVLDEVGTLLAKWPELEIEIGGHADWRGSDAYNLDLSRRRAAAVRDYLVEHFPALQFGQLTFVGYGETRPLVPNTTAANMAKNRRVEFKVLSKGLLRQEVERRRMLRPDEVAHPDTPR